MRSVWRLLIGAPVVLFAASFVLNLAEPDCGYAGAPACESSWVSEWTSQTLLLGLLASGFLAFAVAAQVLSAKAPARARRWVVLAFAVPWAYAAAWAADLFFNDDPCLVFPREGDSPGEDGAHGNYDPVVLNERWPIRTNCRIPVEAGGYRLEQGDASVFYGVFGFWIVIAVLVVLPARLWMKVPAAVAAFVLAVCVMFL